MTDDEKAAFNAALEKFEEDLKKRVPQTGLDAPSDSDIEKMSAYFEGGMHEKKLIISNNSGSVTGASWNPFAHGSVFNPSLTGLTLAAKGLDVSVSGLAITGAVRSAVASAVKFSAYGSDLKTLGKEYELANQCVLFGVIETRSVGAVQENEALDGEDAGAKIHTVSLQLDN